MLTGLVMSFGKTEYGGDGSLMIYTCTSCGYCTPAYAFMAIHKTTNCEKKRSLKDRLFDRKPASAVEMDVPFTGEFLNAIYNPEHAPDKRCELRLHVTEEVIDRAWIVLKDGSIKELG